MSPPACLTLSLSLSLLTFEPTNLPIHLFLLHNYTNNGHSSFLPVSLPRPPTPPPPRPPPLSDISISFTRPPLRNSAYYLKEQKVR